MGQRRSSKRGVVLQLSQSDSYPYYITEQFPPVLNYGAISTPFAQGFMIRDKAALAGDSVVPRRHKITAKECTVPQNVWFTALSDAQA